MCIHIYIYIYVYTSGVENESLFMKIQKNIFFSKAVHSVFSTIITVSIPLEGAFLQIHSAVSFLVMFSTALNLFKSTTS